MQNRPSLLIDARSAAAVAGGFGRAQALASGVIATAAGKVDCGWYDSSFDLAQGLEIVEQDDDALYQLWELSRH